MPPLKKNIERHVSFIGAVGIPNRYGGFESFLENCAPVMAARVGCVTVTCDAKVYPDKLPEYHGVRRVFVGIPANGAFSVIHDLLAFFAVFLRSTHIVVLGVSGGVWFPLFRLLCSIFNKELLVNIDGVEWRRTKFSRWKRVLLRGFDFLSQVFSHKIVFDNAGLASFVLPFCKKKSVLIGYSGDHVLRPAGVPRLKGSVLTVCRIEPENNVEMLIEGFLQSSATSYSIVGNWAGSDYGRNLRQRFESEPRLKLLDPIYDPYALAVLRESCDTYLHGHSVGGTNPSLVEMLFYDCRILCFDVVFNRETAGTCVEYFGDARGLSLILDAAICELPQRGSVRAKCSSAFIAESYLSAMRG